MIDLDAIEKKARWSGWSREDGVEIVKELVAELRIARASLEKGKKCLSAEYAATIIKAYSVLNGALKCKSM